MAEEMEVKTNEQVQEETGEQHGPVPFGGLPLMKPAPGAQEVADLRAKAADAVHAAAANILAAVEKELKALEEFHHPTISGLRSTLGQVKGFLAGHLKE